MLPSVLLNLAKKAGTTIANNKGKTALAGLLGLSAIPRGETQVTQTQPNVVPETMPLQTTIPGKFVNHDQQTPAMYTPAPDPIRTRPVQSNVPTPNPADSWMGSVTTPTPQAPAQSASSAPQAVYDPRMELDQLRAKQMIDRAYGKGAYYVDPEKGYSPDQVRGVMNAADDIYAERVGQMSYEANKALSNPMLEINQKLNGSSDWLNAAVNSGVIPGKTERQITATINRLLTMPEDQQRSTIRSMVYNNLSTGQQQKFDGANEIQSGVDYILTMVPEDFSTNPYKYQAGKFASFLGAQGNDAYQNYQSVVGRITAPVINQIYGAAVTGPELDRAKQSIPNLATDSTQSAIIKLKNLAAFASFANDAQTAQVLGLPRPNLSDYIGEYDKKVESQGVKSGGTKTSETVGWF